MGGAARILKNNPRSSETLSLDKCQMCGVIGNKSPFVHTHGSSVRINCLAIPGLASPDQMRKDADHPRFPPMRKLFVYTTFRPNNERHTRENSGYVVDSTNSS